MQFYILGSIVESAAGFIVLFPILLLFHILRAKMSKRDNLKVPVAHIIAVNIFCLVLMAILSVTGIPDVYSLRADFNVNMIPVFGRASHAQYVPNILLFVPLGFFLPVLWEKYEKWSLTLLTGLLFSLAIELSQIFTYRATDIDDLIMNTLGTVAGYLIFLLIKKIFPKISRLSVKKDAKSWVGESYLIFILTWAVMFLVQPIIASWLWSFTPYMVRL